jgi:antigen flippase
MSRNPHDKRSGEGDQTVNPTQQQSSRGACTIEPSATSSSSTDSSYGRILKSSALLGGSSVINVGLGIVRTKILALQLGPGPFGIMALYDSLTSMIGGVASLGIGQSAVRDVAAAAGSGDQTRIAQTIRVLQRVVWITGLLGLLATLALAYPASSWTFGDHDHVWAIAVLSVTVLFTQLQAGQTALLQGLRRIRDLTAKNVFGAIWCTAMAIPILLCLRERGVVPFLVALAAGQLGVTWWYARRVSILPVTVTWRQTWTQSREMMSLGLAFVISGLALSASTYAIRVILQRSLGAAGVGLYYSAFNICGFYVSFILQAMAGDYYPRLAEVGADAVKRNRLVSEQMEMAILLAVPGLIAALVLSGLLIWALYSSRFAGAEEVLRWQVLGLFGRIIAWPLGFLLLARGDRRGYLSCEIASQLVHVGLVYAGVRGFGLAGAGAAFAGLYLFNTVLVYLAVRRRHSYTPQRSTRTLVLLGALLVAAAFGTTFAGNMTWRLASGGFVLAAAAVFSLRGLAERLGRERIVMVYRMLAARLGFARP